TPSGACRPASSPMTCAASCGPSRKSKSAASSSTTCRPGGGARCPTAAPGCRGAAARACAAPWKARPSPACGSCRPRARNGLPGVGLTGNRPLWIDRRGLARRAQAKAVDFAGRIEGPPEQDRVRVMGEVRGAPVLGVSVALHELLLDDLGFDAGTRHQAVEL